MPLPGALTSTILMTRGSTRSSGTWPPVSSEHGASRVEQPLHQRIDALLLERLAARHLDEVGAERERPPDRLVDLRCSSPPENAYAESHQTQRSEQPVSRTNAQGNPARVDSPWSDRKISVTRSIGEAESAGEGNGAVSNQGSTTWIFPWSMFMPQEKGNSPVRSGTIRDVRLPMAGSDWRIPNSGRTTSSLQGLDSRRSKTIVSGTPFFATTTSGS